VNRAGNALRDLGVCPGERVLLVLEDSPDFVSAFLGAIKIGAVAVPVSTRLTPRDYEYVARDSAARVAVVNAGLAAEGLRAPRLEHVVATGPGAAPGPSPTFAELLERASSELSAAETEATSPAFWLYTSGTTGTPLAAVHRQRDMLVCSEAFGRHVLEITAQDRTFSVAKLSFAYGLGNALYFPFAVGASTILHPGRPDAQTVFDIVARERPTLFFSVPTGYAAMLRVADAGPGAFASVRRCLSAGERLPAALYHRWRDRFGIELLDGLGSTELCNTFIANRAGRARAGSSGTIVPGYEARITDAAGQEAPSGVVGDLWAKGDSACVAYANQSTRSEETFVDGWVRTGDRYARDEDGYFWFAGRADDMLKVGGLWVSPVEVEGALAEHEAVLEAGVVGMNDPNELTKPLAFVVLAPGHEASPALAARLQDFVKSRLAVYKYPRRIVFVAELPKTVTGKLRRSRLRALALGLGPETPAAAV